MPRISVVIPLFAQGAYVERALRSVLAQGHADLEIIVVDDGSPDDGPLRVERCQDPRLRLLRQSHGGVSRARNAGIMAATGEWLAFLDADDEWLPNFIGEMLDAVQRHPEVNAVLRTIEARRRKRPGFAASRTARKAMLWPITSIF